MKVYIKKMGCKVNEYEAESLATSIKNMGHEISNNPENADCAIVLTCAVTQEAEKKSRQAVSSIYSKNDKIKIFVCGCSSQNSPQDYEKKNSVCAVLGTYNKPQILNMLEDENNKMLNLEMGNGYIHYEIPKIDKTRHFVKIQDGCNNFCSYCLIPYIRGRSRSRNIDECIEEIKLASLESKEVVLTGINVSDFKTATGGLEELIKGIRNINVRLRISSIECNIITEEFLQELTKLKDFCPHFHLPLQSGCDKILKEMNRHYTTQEFLYKVELIRKYFPNCAITTDVIVGFPNETESDFEETLQTINRAHFADIHAFKYSARKGTRLYGLQPLEPKIANNRQQKLLELKRKLHNEFLLSFVGKMVSVLTETIKNGYYVGYSKEYLKVYIPQNETNANRVENVIIKEKYLDGVKGTIKK